MCGGTLCWFGASGLGPRAQGLSFEFRFSGFAFWVRGFVGLQAYRTVHFFKQGSGFRFGPYTLPPNPTP